MTWTKSDISEMYLLRESDLLSLNKKFRIVFTVKEVVQKDGKSDPILKNYIRDHRRTFTIWMERPTNELRTEGRTHLRSRDTCGERESSYVMYIIHNLKKKLVVSKVVKESLDIVSWYYITCESKTTFNYILHQKTSYGKTMKLSD